MGRHLQNLKEASGALWTSREYQGALGYIPPLVLPSLKNPLSPPKP